jgi:hypothetical protein
MERWKRTVGYRILETEPTCGLHWGGWVLVFDTLCPFFASCFLLAVYCAVWMVVQWVVTVHGHIKAQWCCK